MKVGDRVRVRHGTQLCWKIVEFSKEFKKYHMVSPELYPLEELTDELEDELIRILNVENEE